MVPAGNKAKNTFRRSTIITIIKNLTKEHPLKLLFLLLSFIYCLLTVMDLIYRVDFNK